MECTRRQGRYARKWLKTSENAFVFKAGWRDSWPRTYPRRGAPNAGRPCSNVNLDAHAIDAERGGFLTRQCALSYERLSMLYAAITRRLLA